MTRTLAAGGQTANPNNVHLFPSAILLLDGRVLVVGSDRPPDAEVFDPASESWQRTGEMLEPRRRNNGAALLSDGSVLVAGGSFEASCGKEGCIVEQWRSAEIFNRIPASSGQ